MNAIPKQILKIKNLQNIKIGLDIGGSLTKLAVALNKNFILNESNNLNENNLSSSIRLKIQKEFQFSEEIELDDNYLFIKNFQTNKFNTDTVDFLKRLNEIHNFSQIYATGGGAHKFFDLIDQEFKIKMEKHDELISLVRGYIMMNKYKSFYHITGEGGKYETVEEEDLEYPHIAINIGSGVSVLKVDGLNQVKRISGTLMGGGTLVGLSKLLINVDNYNDIMKLAKMGDNSHTDLLVKDIYGSKASSLGLDGDIIASSFGKIHQMIQANEKDKIKKEDIAKSLLVMICYHIAQLGYLVCKQHDIKK